MKLIYRILFLSLCFQYSNLVNGQALESGPMNTHSVLLDGQDDRVRVLDTAPVRQDAIPDVLKLNNGAFSIEASVYLFELPAQGDSKTIIQRGSNNGFEAPFETYRLYIGNYGETNDPKFAFRLTDGLTNESELIIDGGPTVQTGQWYHVAASFEADTAKLYVNGSLVSETIQSVSIGEGSVGFYIGRTVYGDFKGLIDEVRLWNYERDSLEIQDEMSAELFGDETGLIGYWPFDSTYVIEGGLVVTPDLTDNHNDLILQFDAQLVEFPFESEVDLAPLRLIPTDVSGDSDLFTVTGGEWFTTFSALAWPEASVTVNDFPEVMTYLNDTLYWTPPGGEFGLYEIVATATNSAGSLTDTVYLFVDESIKLENNLSVDMTGRAKFGAFGTFGKGIFFNGINGINSGSFSLVDRNDEKFAGGLYTTLNALRQETAFETGSAQFEGFSAVYSELSDANEESPIGLLIEQRIQAREGDNFQLVQYQITNTTGNPLDDIFAQLTFDFDVIDGETPENVGFDGSRDLSYAYNPGVGPAYFGIVSLNYPLAGHSIFINGDDPNYVRSTANLETFTDIPTENGDWRNQLNIGPFDFNTDTVTVNFAIVGGTTLEELQDAADSAQSFFFKSAFENSSAAYFDGRDDRIRVTDANPIGESANPDAYKLNEGELTVEAWIFPMDEPGPNGGREIIKRIANNGFGQDPYATWGLAVLGEDQFSDKPVLSFIISDGVSPIGQGNEIALRDTARVKVGEWTHVAGTYDGSTARLYINGVLANEAEISITIGDGSTGLYIGGDAFASRYFNGLIDEVRIWNTARSGHDILNKKDQTLFGHEPGLAGYWAFESSYNVDVFTVTPDLTGNNNALILQFDAKLVDYPVMTEPSIAPNYLIGVDNASGGDLFAVTGADWRARFSGNGWPLPSINFIDGPAGSFENGDSLFWAPAFDQWGNFDVVATATNAAGSVQDTLSVFVEQIIRGENEFSLDLTHRGKLGAFGNFGRGVFFNNISGVYAADFSLVDRNNGKFAGGLYTAQNSFRPTSGFESVEVPIEGFTGQTATMDDGWEGNPIGVEVELGHYLRVGDNFQILDFRIKNTSGSYVDELFAQFGLDFDIIAGDIPESVGFDADRRLTYAYNPNAGAAYFGLMVLNHPLSGHNIFLNGEDPNYIRTTANLDVFSIVPDSAGDWRSMLNVGPFNLENNEEEFVTFAFVTGLTLEDMLAAADEAKTLVPDNAFENNNSAYMDGQSDRIRITDNNPINELANPDAYKLNEGELTVEAWVFPMDEPGPNGGREIIKRIANNGFGQDPYATWGLAVLGEDQFSDKPVLSFIISDGVSPIGQGNEIALRDTARVKVGEWTHVAGTYDGSTARLYINGILANEAEISITIGEGSTGLYIGGDAFPDRYFNGLIDEVRIWNTARSQTEVFISKDVTLNGDEPGLAGYWPMEEFIEYEDVTGTPDLSANYNNLIVQGSTRLVNSAAKGDVFIAPAEIFLNRTYAITGFIFNAKVIADGWPVPNLSPVSLPDGASLNDRQLFWAPGFGQVGNQSLTLQASNGAGNLNSDINIFVESVRQTVNNEVLVLITSRGAFGLQNFYPFGITFNGRNGLYEGNFGLVSPTDSIFSGGLFKRDHFNMIEDFGSVSSNLPNFETAFQSSFTDALAPKPSGLKITQTLHSKSSSPDSRYAIVEYRIDNPTSQTRDDLYVRLGMDFDVGDANNNLGGYDSLNQLSYVWEANGPNNPDYFGFALLDEPVSGHTSNTSIPGETYSIPLSELTSLVQPVTIPGDVKATISSGPYTLQPGDSLFIAFAISAGSSVEDLTTAVVQARSVYATIATGVTGDVERPTVFALEQNYPNPFNPTTSIKFSVPTASDVTISVFDVLGRQVAELVSKDFVAGTYNVVWNGKNQLGETMASGLYFYQIVAIPQNGDNRFIKTKKMMLLK